MTLWLTLDTTYLIASGGPNDSTRNGRRATAPSRDFGPGIGCARHVAG